MEKSTNYLTLSMAETITRIALFNKGLGINDIAEKVGVSPGALSLWYCKRGMRRHKKQAVVKVKEKKIIYNYVPDMPMHERLKVRHFLSMLHNVYDKKTSNDRPDVMKFMEAYIKLYGVKRNTCSLEEYI